MGGLTLRITTRKFNVGAESMGLEREGDSERVCERETGGGMYSYCNSKLLKLMNRWELCFVSKI